MAAKISKSKKFDTDNAKVEVRILKQLAKPFDWNQCETDHVTNEGYNSILHMADSFIHEKHVIIVFDLFG